MAIVGQSTLDETGAAAIGLAGVLKAPTPAEQREAGRAVAKARC